MMISRRWGTYAPDQAFDVGDDETHRVHFSAAVAARQHAADGTRPLPELMAKGIPRDYKAEVGVLGTPT